MNVGGCFPVDWVAKQKEESLLSTAFPTLCPPEMSIFSMGILLPCLAHYDEPYFPEPQAKMNISFFGLFVVKYLVTTKDK